MKFIVTILFLAIGTCALLAQSGTMDLSFNSIDAGFGSANGANDIVLTTAVHPDGKIIIGGFFTSYNGTERNRIARLNADGSLDATFNPGTGANENVRITALQPDGKIIIGGFFTSYNGTERSRIARLNADGSLDATFNPGSGANNTVMTIALQPDGKVIIGGNFSSINGTARSCIARLNSDGSLDTTFNPGSGANSASSFIFTSALQSDGKIIIGGFFTSYNGTPLNYIARLNADGTLDSTFNSGTGLNGPVGAIALQPDEKIIITGTFTTYNGVSRGCIARLNSDGSLDMTFNPGGAGANFTIAGTAIQPDGKIVIVGDFTNYNGYGRNKIARLNTDGTVDTGFDPGAGAEGSILTTAIQSDGLILIGGEFGSFNNIGRNRIARLTVCDLVPWYLDTDGDGFTVGSSVLSCNSPGAGYVSTSLGVDFNDNDDINDANPDVWRTGNFYVDSDGDLRRVGTVQTLAYGDNTPVGYVAVADALGVDCDDTNNTVWRTGNFYVDADGDSYRVGSAQSLCYGLNTPAGYITWNASLGQDCDDINATVWRIGSFWYDFDNDGHETGYYGTLCYGATTPTDYVLHSDRLGYDCNNLDPNVWRTGSFYADADGDSYYVGSVQVLCYGAATPEGFVAAADAQGVDCNDANANEWQSVTYFIDADGDGYHGSSVVMCFGSEVPAGITTTLGSDCDDANPEVNLAAVELCLDFIDNDCDGGVDESCATLVGNDSPIYAVNMLYSSNMNYPNCYSVQGDFSGSTDSPESITFTGPDEWYKFTAQSTGVSITLTSAVNDDVIELYQKVGSVYTLMAGGIENAGSGAGDFERLNYTGLTPGVIYYISVGAANGAAGGSYTLCIQHLMPSTCATVVPGGGLNICDSYKASYRGAPSQGVTYTFNFTPTGLTGGSATSLSGTNGLITLSNPTLALRYAGTYAVSVDVRYNLLNGAGTAEPVDVLGSAGGNCVNVVMHAQPNTEVRGTQRCNASLLRSNWLVGNAVAGDPKACGVQSYTYEFTQVVSCANGTSVSVLPSLYNTAGTTPYLQLGVLPNLGNTGAWNVRIRPNFSYGEGTFGPVQRIQVAGTAASGELEYELVDMEKEMDIERVGSIYPNPNNGEFVNVSLSNLEKGNLQVRVLDAAGRSITTRTYVVEGSLSTTLTFDEQLSAGVYMIETLNAGRVQTQRLVVQ
jgi:uncharacterized delta-60 repeat protein